MEFNRKNLHLPLSPMSVECCSPKMVISPELSDNNFGNAEELMDKSPGRVEKVFYIPLKIYMARKILFTFSSNDEECLGKMYNEIRLLKKCTSPYIVSYFGVSTPRGSSLYLYMEFMNGGSLNGVCIRDVSCLAKIAYCVLNALKYLQHLNIIHRDIKPANILTNSLHDYKICDFGISIECSVVKEFIGTISYMSPERIQGDYYDVKSDIWSLGITLIEIFHGDNLFKGSFVDIFNRIVHDESLGTIQGHSLLSDFLKLCLIKDINFRPTIIAILTHQFLNEMVEMNEKNIQMV